MKKNIPMIAAGICLLCVIIFTAIMVKNTSEARQYTEQMEIGEKYLAELEYESAVAAYMAAIEIEPKNAEAYIGLAEAYLGMGETDKAIEILEEGISQTDSEELKSMLTSIQQELAEAEKKRIEEEEKAKLAEAEKETEKETETETTTEIEITSKPESETTTVGATTAETTMLIETIVHEELESVQTVNGTIISNDMAGIPDVALYQALLEYYDVNADGVLTEEEVKETYPMQGYCNLNLSEKGIKDLTGINIISKLIAGMGEEWIYQVFDLSHNQIVDITPLGLCAQYGNAFEMDLSYNEIRDIEPLRSFGAKEVYGLTLNNNRIQRIPKGLNIQVYGLSLNNNELVDISGMEGDDGLTGGYVDLRNNRIEDINPLINRGYLSLYLDNNNISVLPTNLETSSMFTRMVGTGGMMASNSEMAEIMRESLRADGTVEYREVLFSISGNPLTETEAREKLPEYVVNFVSPSGLVWFDMQGFIK